MCYELSTSINISNFMLNGEYVRVAVSVFSSVLKLVFLVVLSHIYFCSVSKFMTSRLALDK